MPKYLLALFVAFMLFAPDLNAQKIKQKNVPFDVLVVFRDTYPAARGLAWRKHTNGFQVDFEHLGKRKQVVYRPDLSWVRRESQLGEVELPLPAQAYLQEHHADCEVQRIRALETKETVQLEVAVLCSNDRKPLLLFFDRTGRIQKD